jgi:DNA-directed RNA polymerase subunit alpha
MKWKSLHMPKAVELDEDTFTEQYGKFLVEPLERGFGTTLGNALRRALLSSIQGAAICAVKLDGTQHEFSTIEGVVEDVPEIVMNLKEIYCKLYADAPKVILVEKRGSGEWVGGDLEVDPEVEILNKDHHIATLAEDGRIEAEITFRDGRGYVPSEENRLPDQPVGTVVMDSIFSPVTKVNFTVGDARVGRRTDYDKLTLEVWTNGAIRPDDAVAFAAKVLKDHLDLFINFEDERIELEDEDVDFEAVRIRNLLNLSIDELELSVRSANCLRAAGIIRLEDLVQRTEQEMLKYRNFGKKSLSELSGILEGLGLYFGMDLSKYKLGKDRSGSGVSAVSRPNDDAT